MEVAKVVIGVLPRSAAVPGGGVRVSYPQP